ERADGVPDPDIGDPQRHRPAPVAPRPRALAPVPFAVGGKDVGGIGGAECKGALTLRMILRRLRPVERERVPDPAGMRAGKDAAVANHPRERAGGEGAPREAEQEDLVAGTV